MHGVVSILYNFDYQEIFLMMARNYQWPKIKNQLLIGQSVFDHLEMAPWAVCLKVCMLMKFSTNELVTGETNAKV